MTLPDFLTADKYGYIHLVGHRIGLRHVVDLHNERYPPDLILEELPTLSLVLIQKVIAFYLDNQGEVDAYITECNAELERQMAAPRKGPDAAELQRRLEVLRKARERA